MQQVFENVELPVPVVFVMTYPFESAVHRQGIETADVRASLDRAPDQSRALQYLDVFRHGLQRHVERARQFADALIAVRQASQQSSARRVGEGVENAVQLFG